MDQNELRHYGVLGMKWGVRKDKYLRKMRLRKARKKREAAKKKEEAKAARQEKAAKSVAKNSKRGAISQMSDEQIRDAIQRIRLEKELEALMSEPKKTSSIGKGASAVGRVLAKAGAEGLTAAVKTTAPKLAEHYFVQKGWIDKPEKKEKDK